MNEPCAVHIGNSYFVLNMYFASKRGRDEFLHDFPQIRQILEEYAKMKEAEPAEMSTPLTERLPFVAP